MIIIGMRVKARVLLMIIMMMLITIHWWLITDHSTFQSLVITIMIMGWWSRPACLKLWQRWWKDNNDDDYTWPLLWPLQSLKYPASHESWWLSSWWWLWPGLSSSAVNYPQVYLMCSTRLLREAFEPLGDNSQTPNSTQRTYKHVVAGMIWYDKDKSRFSTMMMRLPG